LVPFPKQFKASTDLVKLLQQRGLTISDAAKAKHYIDNIGYYRLSAYMYPLLRQPKSAHLYKRNATFEQVMMLYRFDRKLRKLIFNEIEKVEIAIRCAVMQITTEMTGDPFWLTTPSYFSNQNNFSDTLHTIQKEYDHSSEEFILHFRSTYSNPFPPAWILGELLTLGNINAIYRNIRQDRIRKRIAKRFGLPINVFESWLTIIAVTRNACAHHARVWNKKNTIPPAMLSRPIGGWITLPTDKMRIYFDICIIKYFLNTVSPGNDLGQKILELLADFPNIDTAAMGIPFGWENEPLWQYT
jgi:abortive infection bacteriophage resistance protein